MMELRSLFLAAVSLLLFLPSPLIVSADEDHNNNMIDTSTCSCSLTTLPENEAGCAIYGYHLDHLMPWVYVDFRCLREFNISVENELDVAEVAIMCPLRNGTDADVTAIVDAFRENTPIGNFLKSQYTEYFVLNNATGNYEWKETIQSENNAQLVDCSGDDSFCYQVISIYLSQSDRAANELEFICGEVHKQFYDYAFQQQSEVREALCASVPSGGVNTSSICYPLYEQIMGHADAEGNVDCTDIGNGPGDEEIPDVCDGPVADGDESDVGDNSGESSAAFVSASSFSMVAIVGYLVAFL